MAGVSFSGIASGIDSDALIKAQLDAVRNTRVAPNEKKITELEDINSGLTSLKTKLTTLQDKLQTFRAISGGGIAKTATSSDDSVLTATASSAVNNGSYQISVNQLATPGRIVIPSTAATFATGATLGDAPITLSGAGTFNFKFKEGATDEVTVSTAVTTATTLAALSSSLNDDSTFNQYAEASIINVGSSTTPAYRLVITTKNTGGADTVGDVGFTVSGATLGTTPTQTDGTNAEFTITGLGSTVISRSNNDVTDVITGLTLSLRDTGTTKVTVGIDSTTTKSRVKEFVDAYNDVVAFLQESNVVQRSTSGKEVTNVFGPLAKVSVDENMISLIRNSISSAQASSGTTVRIFSDIGITTNSGAYDSNTKTGGGTLNLDSDTVSNLTNTTLLSALATEPDSVRELLEGFAETVAAPVTGLIAQFVNFNRLLDTTINANKEQIDNLNTRISEAEGQIAKQEESLRARYARLESLMGGLQAKQNSLASALSGLG